MTDREKLIELLSENFCEYCNVDIIAGSCKIRAITFDVDRFADFLISNGVTFQKWIPVSEMHPEQYRTVLVWNRFKEIGEAEFNGEQFMWMDDDGVHDYAHATHWMPLPEPPKEEDK